MNSTPSSPQCSDILRQQILSLPPSHPTPPTELDTERRHFLEIDGPNHTIRRSLADAKRASRRSVLVSIGDAHVLGLVDSGADISVISHSLAQRLQLDIKPSTTKLSGPDGHALTCYGAVHTHIVVQGKHIPLTACVINHLHDNLLLGDDFLRPNKAVIHCETGTVTLLGDEDITLKPAPASTSSKRGQIAAVTEYINKIEQEVKSEESKIKEITDHIDTIEHIPLGHRKTLAELLSHYPEALVHDILPLITNFYARIRVPKDAKPVRHKERNYPPNTRDTIIVEVNKLLKQGWVEKCTGPWRARCVPILKPDGTIRFCIDYRDLNAVTTDDAFPAPNAETIFDRLQGKKYFTSLDLKKGYYQVELDENSRDYTGFGCPLGLFRWTVLPMGVKNACAIFQRLMQNILKPYLGIFCDVYLDDILIYSDSIEEHFKHVKIIMDLIKERQLSVNFHKCQWMVKELKFLGEIISEDGRRADPEKTAAIVNLLTPTTKKEMRQFMGMANYHRAHIKGFAEIARPLNALLHNDIKGNSITKHWTDIHENAYNTIKNLLVNAPVLAHPNFAKPFIIEVDASEHTMGAMLCQEYKLPNGRKTHRPVEYASATFTKGQRNYSATDREGMGVMWACEKFHRYLIRDPVTIITDHQPLVSMQRTNQATKLVESWRAKLQIYRPIFIHRSGREHVVADALSRLTSHPPPSTVKDDFDDMHLHKQYNDEEANSIRRLVIRQIEADSCAAVPTDTNAWILAQREDPLFGDIVSALETADKDPKKFLTTGMAFVSKAHQHFTLRDDGLLMLATAGSKYHPDEVELVVATPAKLIPSVLRTTHAGPDTGAHLSVKKLYPILRKKFWWPTMYRDLAAYIGGCLTCQRYNQGVYRQSELQPYTATTCAMQAVSIDTITLPRSGRFDKALVAVDHFTRFCFAIPLSNATAETVAHTIRLHITSVFGYPQVFIADNGPEFRNERFINECKSKGTELRFTSTHHPQANPVERTNRTLIAMLRTTADNATDWPTRIMDVTQAFNSAAITGTDVSPHDAIFTFKQKNDMERALHIIDPDLSTPQHLAQSQADNAKMIEETRDARISRGRTAANKTRKAPHVYAPGQLVWKRNLAQVDHRHHNRDNKLQPHWQGPCVVVKRHKSSSTTYSVRPVGSDKRGNVHVDTIKPLHDDNNNPVVIKDGSVLDMLCTQANQDPHHPDTTSKSKGIARQQRVPRASGRKWEVEEIIGYRILDSSVLHLHVKWKGYPLSEATWEPESNVDAPDKTREFFAKLTSIRATADEGRLASAK